MAKTAQERRAQAKKEQIAAAARELFLANGYAGTTMDAVSAEAGVSKQTLYAYFPSKADLLTEMLTEEIAALNLDAAVVPTLESIEDLRATLATIARRVTSKLMHDDAQQLLRLVIGEAVRLPELRDLIRQAFPERLLNQAETLIRVATARGFIDSPRPELSARMFVGPPMSFVALDGLFHSEPATPPDDVTLSFIIDAFLSTVAVAGQP